MGTSGTVGRSCFAGEIKMDLADYVLWNSSAFTLEEIIIINLSVNAAVNREKELPL